MLTHVESHFYTPVYPSVLPFSCLLYVCVCYMHFAQILSFPFRLDSNKNNVNKSYNNNKQGNINCFVGNALFGVVVAGAKLARRCLRCCCCRVYPTNANRQWQQQQQPQPVRRAIHVRPPVCLFGRAKMPSGWAAAATWGKGEAVVDSILHEKGEGGCKLQELGIGTGLLLLLGGRNWLPAVLNYKRSLFFWFCLQHIQFFFVYGMNCHFVVVVFLLPNQCWQILWQSETQKKE